MVSERVGPDLCGLQRRWVLDSTLVHMLARLDAWATQIFSARRLRWPGIYVISGHRNEPIEPELSPGTPAATDSRHLRCPSLAVDLRVGNVFASVTPLEVWTFLGLAWERAGGRWGGRFLPVDPNHFDINPAIVGGGFELPG